MKGPQQASLPPILLLTCPCQPDSLTRYSQTKTSFLKPVREQLLSVILIVCARCLARPCCCSACWLWLTRRTNRRLWAASQSRWGYWFCSLGSRWAATAATPSTPPGTSGRGSSLPWQAGELKSSGMQEGRVSFDWSVCSSVVRTRVLCLS